MLKTFCYLSYKIVLVLLGLSDLVLFFVNIKTYFINSLVLSFKTNQTETKPITQTNKICRVNCIQLQRMWKWEELPDVVIRHSIYVHHHDVSVISEVTAPQGKGLDPEGGAVGWCYGEHPGHSQNLGRQISMAHMWTSEDKLQESISLLHPLGSRDKTWIVLLGVKLLHLLIHLTILLVSFWPKTTLVSLFNCSCCGRAFASLLKSAHQWPDCWLYCSTCRIVSLGLNFKNYLGNILMKISKIER